MKIDINWVNLLGFIQDSVSLEGCQINPIVVNFYLQKSLEIFDKNSADKIWSKKDKEIKVSPLMPIRVNGVVEEAFMYTVCQD